MVSDDQSQKAVINSTDKRLFVEAPAGYGKTTVMVEKLILDLESNKIAYPKRALALTFSVNAARKMKNDIYAALDKTGRQGRSSKNRVDVLNYHALSRQIIMKYGLVSFGSKVDTNVLTPMNESRVLSYFQNKRIPLSKQDNQILNSFSKAVNQADSTSIDGLIDQYYDLIIKKLIPSGCITYNAILILAIKILKNNQSICNLYRSLYPYVIVDEAQDTNLLGYRLFTCIVSDRTRICMFGDSLQRIYGFIGAIPNFVDHVVNDFGLKIMKLKTNHRFLPGSPMQLLDKNIRENIRNPLTPSIGNDSKVPLLSANTIESELEQTCKLAHAILKMQAGIKISVLVRSRNTYSEKLIGVMHEEGVSCFDGLFNDDDEEYIRFNECCLDELDNLTEGINEINFSLLEKFVNGAEQAIDNGRFAHGASYKQLLNGLLNQIKQEFAGASQNLKYQYVRSVLENRSLRHTIDYIDVDVVVMTMHASKGLEWDYVILPEMIQWVSPAFATCKDCMSLKANEIRSNKCYFQKSTEPQSFLDELCLFYVAVTRARRSATFVMTTDRVNKGGEHKRGNLSCFASLPGIQVFSPKSLQDIIIS